MKWKKDRLSQAFRLRGAGCGCWCRVEDSRLESLTKERGPGTLARDAHDVSLSGLARAYH